MSDLFAHDPSAAIGNAKMAEDDDGLAVELNLGVHPTRPADHSDSGGTRIPFPGGESLFGPDTN